jgi:hypothetical protein
LSGALVAPSVKSEVGNFVSLTIILAMIIDLHKSFPLITSHRLNSLPLPIPHLLSIQLPIPATPRMSALSLSRPPQWRVHKSRHHLVRGWSRAPKQLPSATTF